MVNARVEAAVHELGQLTSYDLRLEYIHSLPEDIRARVVGEVLDRGNRRNYMDEYAQRHRLKVVTVAEKPCNPWIPNFNLR